MRKAFMAAVVICAVALLAGCGSLYSTIKVQNQLSYDFTLCFGTYTDVHSRSSDCSKLVTAGNEASIIAQSGRDYNAWTEHTIGNTTYIMVLKESADVNTVFNFQKGQSYVLKFFANPNEAYSFDVSP
jgi:hypothetical protein